MKSRILTVLPLLAFGLLFAACRPTSADVIAIALGFPHGETYLVVQREGDARLGYGAMLGNPVRGDAFDIDQIFDDLQESLQPVEPAGNRPFDQPYGMVTFSY
jgi:hypothetical protein